MDADQVRSATCSQPEVANLFPSYIDGDVDEAERERIEEHLADCIECQENLRFFLDMQKIGRELLRTK